MAGSLSSLVVKLALDAADFIVGLDRADKDAKKFAASMERDAKRIGAAIGIHVSAATTALFLMTKNAIDTADKLNDLSKSTGIAAETLGGLGFAAKQSGTDLEGVAASVGKLNIKIGAAIAGNKDAALAFEKVGISLKELRSSSPDQILQKLADRFATYDDHANTAALANLYFGKSYQSILPLLREGGDSLRKNIAYFEKYGGVNKDVVRQADEFNDTLTKLGLLSGAFARNLAAALLPSLQSVANEFVKAKEKGDGFKSGAEGLAEVLKTLAVGATYTGFAFAKLGTYIGGVAAVYGAFLSLEFKRAITIAQELNADLDRMTAQRDAIIKAIRDPTAAVTPSALPGGGGRVRAPSIPDSGAASAANAAAKALLDAQLKDVDNFIKEERDLHKDRLHFLQEYYADDLISIAKYYSTRQQFLDDQVKKEVAANEERIALLQKYRPKDEADRIKNEREIQDVIANTRKIEREYFNESIDNRIAATRSVKQFQESLEQVQITLLAMRGDTVGAATRGVVAQFADERRRRLVAGESTADIDEIIKLTTQQAQLNQATKDYQLTLSELGIEQERINIAASNGFISELEALRQRSDMQQSFIPKLREELEIARAIAAATGRREDIVRVKELTVALEGLAAQGDLAAKKFREIFETGFADAFTSFIDGTKSAKDAFKDFANSVLRDINRIVAKELANKLFGGGSTGGDFIGQLFSMLFGGGGGTGGPLAGLSGGGMGAPGFATGTNFAPGGWAMVHRDELIRLPRGSQVIPARESRQIGSTTINVNVLPGATKQSGAQAADVMTRRQLQAARNR